jgi:hypothetical protein
MHYFDGRQERLCDELVNAGSSVPKDQHAVDIPSDYARFAQFEDMKLFNIKNLERLCAQSRASCQAQMMLVR